MKKLMTCPQARALANLIGMAFPKLTGRDKVEVTRVIITLQPIVKEIDDAQEEAIKKLTEGHDEEQSLLTRFHQNDATMTEDETEKAKQWEKTLLDDLNEAMKDVAEKEHEVGVTPLSDDALASIYDALPNLSPADTTFIQKMLGNDGMDNDI